MTLNIMTDNQIYRQLQIQLDEYPIGYPATKSGVEIDILKYFFNPLGAKIALCLTLRSIPVNKIRKRLKDKFAIELSRDALSALLTEMFRKGVISRSGSPVLHVTALPCWRSACLNIMLMISPASWWK